MGCRGHWNTLDAALDAGFAAVVLEAGFDATDLDAGLGFGDLLCSHSDNLSAVIFSSACNNRQSTSLTLIMPIGYTEKECLLEISFLYALVSPSPVYD